MVQSNGQWRHQQVFHTSEVKLLQRYIGLTKSRTRTSEKGSASFLSQIKTKNCTEIRVALQKLLPGHTKYTTRRQPAKRIDGELRVPYDSVLPEAWKHSSYSFRSESNTAKTAADLIIQSKRPKAARGEDWCRTFFFLPETWRSNFGTFSQVIQAKRARGPRRRLMDNFSSRYDSFWPQIPDAVLKETVESRS